MCIENTQRFTVHFVSGTVHYRRIFLGQIVSHPAGVCLLAFYNHVTVVFVLCQLSSV